MAGPLRTANAPAPATPPGGNNATPEGWGQLHEQIARSGRDPYLLTVTADNRPHCATVTVQWDTSGRRLITAAPSSWPGSAESGYCQVSLVWPPPQPDGYSLIIDGDAATTASGGKQMIAIGPTRAVLYRRGPSLPGTDTSCSSDCIPVLSL